MRVEANVATRELHPIATLTSSERLGRREELGTHATASLVGSHVHTFEFAAPPSGVLEVGKDHDLTDAYHLVPVRRDEHVTTTTSRLFDRVPVLRHLVLVLELRRE